MTGSTRAERNALGAWRPGALSPRTDAASFTDALLAFGRPLSVVSQSGTPAVAMGGTSQLGVTPRPPALPLLGHVPPLFPDELGDAAFRRTHQARYAYVVGEMANGIASETMVEVAAKAGMVGVFGAAGLSVERITAAMKRLEKSCAGLAWGVNLIHSPEDPLLETSVAELFLERGLRFVSASAYLDLTLPIVMYRLAGIHRAPDGAIVTPNRVMAKVSRVEVARRFLEPAPERFVKQLVGRGFLSDEQAKLAAHVPMADDVTAEADSGGHTDNRPLVVLLPALQALRDEISSKHAYAVRPRIGAAGGIATPASVASAFAMGAAYVVTGSVNQGTREAGTSDAVRQMLAQAASTDVAMAPAADMFEMGVKVQVSTRGSLFAVRAGKLYEWYRAYDSMEALPRDVKDDLEKKYFKQPLKDAWASVVRYFEERDAAQIERAGREPKHKLALLFRSYLGQASHWANDGVADRRLDFQVWCGPAMGAFNEWVKGSPLEKWEARHVVPIAKNLLVGATMLTRLAALRSQGVEVPAGAGSFAPLDEETLDLLLNAEEDALQDATDDAPDEDVEVIVEDDVSDSRPVAPPVFAPSGIIAAPPRIKDEPIAIVGMGALFPKADNAQAFWKLIRSGVDAVGDVPESHWKLADYYDADPKAPDMTYAKRGAFLSAQSFDPTEFGIPPNILEATDTSQLLGLIAARMAMEDAGYGETATFDRTRASVILGVTGTQELVISLGARLGHPHWKKALKEAGVDEETARDVVERIGRSYVGWQENSFPGLLGNVIAGRIANRLDFGGTNCVIDAACASSLGAVHLGVLELRAGKSDLVLTGGVDCINDIFMHMCFSKTPALSTSGDVRPFSDKADGTLLGEGLGMVVLRRLSDAERDGDRIHAVIRSVGSSSDGRAKSIYAPLPRGQARALRNAYREAGVRPRDIGLLEAHGTGTKAGDVAEFEALSEVYREESKDPAWCVIGSVKSQIGHTKAAAGAAGLLKAALALKHKVLPPTLKVDKPNPAMKLEESPFAIASAARPWLRTENGPRFAAVSAFGFGGSNFHAVLEEHGAQRPDVAWDGSVELVTLSSNDAASLLAELGKAQHLTRDELPAFAKASRATFNHQHAHRLLACVGEHTDMAKLFAQAAVRLRVDVNASFVLPEGLAYGAGAPKGKLAFLFPGQGSQHVDMARELSCLFPEMLEAMEAAPDVARQIYPLPTFDDALKTKREQQLTKTDVAQPALGLVAMGMTNVLRRFGVKPELAAGHSYGELVALHVAGVMDAQTLVQVSRLRGELMAGNGEDRGTMLAVLSSLKDIEKLIATDKLPVVLANRNGPTQGVLSGSREAIAQAEAACAKQGLRTAKLNVGAAFHSPLVAPASKQFKVGLDALPMHAPSIPVVADSTAQPYGSEVGALKELLAEQLARPVLFDGVVEKLSSLGATTFLEVGPRSTLTGMVRAIMGTKPHAALAVDGAKGGLFEFAFVLARIGALGHELDVKPWQAQQPAPRSAKTVTRVQKMSVPLSGVNYRSPVAPLPPRPPRAVPMMTTASPRAAQLEAQLAALKAMQEQTARTHQLFLEGQLRAQQALSGLGGNTSALPSFTMPVMPSLPAPVLPAPAPVATVTTSVNTNDVVLSVVADATGYPKETLNLSMDMEADLGIDSIKRVEILSLVSKRIPGAPSVAPEKLGGLRTLQHVVDFIGANISTHVVTSEAPKSVSAPPAQDTTEIILSVVAEATGYPRETLNLSMDMEADLGIDSIKRVEILSLVSKRIPGAPSVAPEKLGGLRTLQHVAEFVGANISTKTIAPAAPAPSASVNASPEIILEVVAEATGYPKETLTLDMDMEADLGIDSIKRVEILSLVSKRIPGAPSVNPEKLGGLRTLRNVVEFIGAAPSNGVVHVKANGVHAKAAVVETAGVQRRAVAVGRVAKPAACAHPEQPVWVVGSGALAQALVAALSKRNLTAQLAKFDDAAPAKLGGVVLIDEGTEWSAAAEAKLKANLKLARQTSSALRHSNTFFSTVTVRDGAFGSLSGGGSALSQGFSAAAKTLSHEWPEVRCKAIDVSASWSTSEAAEAIAEELLLTGPTEVGLGPVGRVGLGLVAAPMTRGHARLGKGDVVVVTGGARGVTASCAKALAVETGASLLLLGRSPMPSQEPTWLAAATDEAAIKKALIDNAPSGVKPTPKTIGEAFRGVMAAREIRETLAELSHAGVKAKYASCDVREERSLNAALATARTELGPIAAIVHGAGVLRDKRIEDKRDEDLDAVIDTKVAGLRTLLAATRGDELKFIALFASVSGRFGRKGQADYAVANQALVSIAQHEATSRPNARVVALDWGPWAGGMVTPALKAEFDKEGVALIDLEAGARALVDEVFVQRGPVEVVIGSGFGATNLIETRLLKTEQLSKSAPIFRDHQLAGKAVLPFALTLEWFAAAAKSCAPHASLVALEDARMLRGVTFESSADVSVWATPLDDGKFTMELRGAEDVVHARAVAVMGTSVSSPSELPAPSGLKPFADSMKSAYAEQLFHGPSLETIESIEGMSNEGMAFRMKSSPTSERLLSGAPTTWAIDPLALDGVFQALILWTRANSGGPSLPSRLGALRLYRPFTSQLKSVVRVTSVEGAIVTANVDLLDESGLVAARLEGYACTVSPNLDRAFTQAAAPTPAVSPSA